MRMERPALVCFMVFFSTCIYAGQGSPKPNVSVAPYFVVAPGATGVWQTTFQGKEQITYHIRSEYPAEDVVATIKERLKQLGWEPLKEDWLNPGLPSSLTRGWAYYEDFSTKPHTSVRSWNADWQNGSQDILAYMLTYTCPDNQCASTRDLYDLRVIGIHIPADLAKRIKASIPRDEKAK